MIDGHVTVSDKRCISDPPGLSFFHAHPPVSSGESLKDKTHVKEDNESWSHVINSNGTSCIMMP